MSTPSSPSTFSRTCFRTMSRISVLSNCLPLPLRSTAVPQIVFFDRPQRLGPLETDLMHEMLAGDRLLKPGPLRRAQRALEELDDDAVLPGDVPGDVERQSGDIGSANDVCEE